jgi:hypothetical protein
MGKEYQNISWFSFILLVNTIEKGVQLVLEQGNQYDTDGNNSNRKGE